MNIQPINEPVTFGVYKKTKLSRYAYKCYIERDYGEFKGYELAVQRNYLNGQLASTLISIKKAGEWVKSKLKYFSNGRKTKVLRGQNDRMV